MSEKNDAVAALTELANQLEAPYLSADPGIHDCGHPGPITPILLQTTQAFGHPRETLIGRGWIPCLAGQQMVM